MNKWNENTLKIKFKLTIMNFKLFFRVFRHKKEIKINTFAWLK